MSVLEFVDALCALQLEDTFNPYVHKCPVSDLAHAPDLRRQTLLAILHAATLVHIDALWIGRDLGYRGGRRTGLALTDDLHLNSYTRRWGFTIERPTKGPPIGERTAAVTWSILALVDAPIFLWNVFPLHPHETGDPFSNRAHSAREGRIGEDFLSALVGMLRPNRLIAIGNDAARVVRRIAGSREAVTVRHPSYGGQTAFLRQMRSLYALQGEGMPRNTI